MKICVLCNRAPEIKGPAGHWDMRKGSSALSENESPKET